MQTDFFLLALLWCYSGVTLWQMLVCCGIYARFAFFSTEKNRLQERQKNKLPPPFSVIICARNEAENLQRYLPAVLQQEYPGEWEVIVVDDASSDATAGVVLDFQANTRSGRSWFRSLLERASAAHVLHFVNTPDLVCLERIARRNVERPPGSHHLSEEDFIHISSFFQAPEADEGFNVRQYTP